MPHRWVYCYCYYWRCHRGKFDVDAKLFYFIKALSQPDLDLSVPSALPSTGEATVRSYTHRPAFSPAKQLPDTMSYNVLLSVSIENVNAEELAMDMKSITDRAAQTLLWTELFRGVCLFTFFLPVFMVLVLHLDQHAEALQYINLCCWIHNNNHNKLLFLLLLLLLFYCIIILYYYYYYSVIFCVYCMFRH